MTEDGKLVQRIRAGDQFAFRELVERHKQMVYYLAYDMCGNQADAEDVSQDVFMKVYRAIDRFDASGSLGAWVRRIAVNTAIDARRKRKPTVGLAGHTDESGDYAGLDIAASGHEVNPEQRAGSADIDDRVRAALDQLSAQERAVFILRHYEDMKLQDIAKTLTIAEGTVKSALFRSTRKLREMLSAFRDDLGLEDTA